MAKKNNFNPNQLRWGKGHPLGGRWKSTADIVAEKALRASGIGSVNLAKMKNEGYKVGKQDYNAGQYASVKVVMDNGVKAMKKPNIADPNDRRVRRWGADSSKREALTYEVDEALGLGVVPYTYFDKSEDASFQMWIDNTTVGEFHDYDDPIQIEDLSKMMLLDYVTGNPDRHDGNWITQPEVVLTDFGNGQTKSNIIHRMWAIDNGLAFYPAGRIDWRGTEFWYCRKWIDKICGMSSALDNAGWGTSNNLPLSHHYKDILQDLYDNDFFRTGNFADVLSVDQIYDIEDRVDYILSNWEKFFYDPELGETMETTWW
jgi:hypothetical protein